ncbi:hypothetical protein ONZ45_g4859 [Pleurotus djamor]|nr:hypothetical protein ONZ45_g4859 [Pleurotus djamor]
MSWFYSYEGAFVDGSAGKAMCARDFLQDTKAKLQDRLLDHDELQVWRLTPSLRVDKAMAVLKNPQFIIKLSENKSEAAWAFDHLQLERVTSDSNLVTNQDNDPLFVDFFVFKSERFQRSTDLNLDDRYSDTFIKVTDWGSFCQDDLRLNVIRELQDAEDAPSFVEEFKQKLFQSTTLSNDSPEPHCLAAYCDLTSIPPSLAHLENPQPQPHSSEATSHGDTATEHRALSSTEPSPDVQNDDSKQVDQPMVQVNPPATRDATLSEIAHLISLSMPWQDIWKDRTRGLPLKEGVFKAMMMASILLSVHQANSEGRYYTLELSDYRGKIAGIEYVPTSSQITTDVLPEKRLFLVARSSPSLSHRSEFHPPQSS